MKKILFLLALLPFVAFGQHTTNFGKSGDGDVSKSDSGVIFATPYMLDTLTVSAAGAVMLVDSGVWAGGYITPKGLNDSLLLKLNKADSALMAGGYTSYADGLVISSGLVAKLNKADSAAMAGGYTSYADGIAGLALKANIASPTFTGTVGGVTATMVGLGNVTNKAQVELEDSAAYASGYMTRYDGITGLALKLNKADSVNYADGYMSRYDGVIGLALKANLASPTFTGTVGADVITATGVITGAVSITLDTDATIVLTAAQCRNTVRINNDADVIDYTLPDATTGLIILFYDIAGGVITIDAQAGDEIYLNGASVGAGDAIDSPGVISNFICLMAIDGTRWISLGQSGVWVDGGAD